MTTTPEPISPDEADAAFAGLMRFDRIVLAVSGGPDSLALMHLAADWALRHGRSVFVATVDHGLRRESRGEAEMVAAQAAALGLSHAILTWSGPKPGTGIADAARRARYSLLEAHASELANGAPSTVVTAHHRDDQAETFLMRLARGSGVPGLSGIPPLRPISEASCIMLARPFLPFPKTRLLATLAARGVRSADDPTNTDSTYERVRMRAVAAILEREGIAAEALAESARRIGEAREALDHAVETFSRELSIAYNGGVFADFERRAFDQAPVYLRERVLERLIARFSGASPPPRHSEIENLALRIATRPTCTATLGGVVLSAGERRLRLWREAGRLDASDFALEPGKSVVWDRRFWLMRNAEARQLPHALSVRPLGEAGLRRIASVLDSGRLPSRAAHGVPAIWSGQDLVAVPVLQPFAIAVDGRLACPGIDCRPATSAP